MQKILFLFFFCCCIHKTVFAQQQQIQMLNGGRALLLDINYGAAKPGGDMKDRFGLTFDVGGGFELMTGSQNWIFGVGGGVLFGTEVKEDVLASLRTPEGGIIGSNSAIASISLKERGFHVEARFGKLIPLIADNPRSGLRLVMGVGLLQHKIRLQEDPQSNVPQIINDYAKGYDHLSNGLMLREFIGYQHLAKNKLVNFYAGFELTQAFTQNRRDWDFATGMMSDKSDRKDLLVGLKAGWILPFYTSKSNSDNIRY